MVRSAANFVVVCLMVAVNSELYSQDKLSIDKDHMLGVVEAHAVSLEGWRTGDVLIRVTSSGHGRYIRLEDDPGPRGQPKYVEGPDASSIVVQEDRLFRVLFDFDDQMCLVVGSNREERVIFDALDNELTPKVTDRSGAFLFNDPEKGVLTVGTDGRLFRALEMTTVSGALSVSGAPDIRLLGWNTVSSWDCEYLRDRIAALANVDAISIVSHVGRDSYQLVYPGHTEGTEKKYHWDVKRNVPQKFWVGRTSDGFASHDASAQWQSIDGHHVPVSSQYMLAEIIMDGSRWYLMFHEVAVDIHWFSFNKELPEELFQDEILRDRKKLDELLSQEVFGKRSEDKSRENTK